MKLALKLNQMAPLVTRGRRMNIFNCKRINITKAGKNFKEEYVMLKKRARSVEAKKFLKMITHDSGKLDESLKGLHLEEFDDKQQHIGMNLRAKSIEAKKKRLLAESVKFQQRIDIMR